MESNPLAEAYRNAAVVSEADLTDLKTKSPLWTIVCVKELMNCPLILIGNDDTPVSNRAWVQFSGQTKDEFILYFKWIDEGRRLFDKAPRSVEELEHLRQCIMAAATIGDLVKYRQDAGKEVMSVVIIHIAAEWYHHDHADETIDTVKLIGDETKLAPYLDLVTRYVERLSKVFSTVKASCDLANSEQPEATP